MTLYVHLCAPTGPAAADVDSHPGPDLPPPGRSGRAVVWSPPLFLGAPHCRTTSGPKEREEEYHEYELCDLVDRPQGTNIARELFRAAGEV